MRLLLLLMCGVVLSGSAWAGPAEVDFDQYFVDKTMRIDYLHTGNAEVEVVALDRVYAYGKWAGSLVNLVDNLNYGAYYHKIYDADGTTLIYSRGCDSYFKEYRTTRPAKDGVQKSFHESAIVPCPRSPVIFAVERRQKEGNMIEVFRTEIDPRDFSVIRDEGGDPSVFVFQSLDNGDPHVKADVAIVGEGYTTDELDKFQADVKRFTEVFFREEPCKSNRQHFNVYGVCRPSPESGVDEPRHGSFKNTAVGATFNSLGSERYLLTEDNQALRDIASHVPYDAVYIMVNHKRYGGGGIYNFYCVYTSDNQWSEYVMVHEFGHSFFGLADEYYTSSVAYDDFYPAGYEPSEPNITALLDPENVKWKHLLAEGIEVPTRWEKEAYDKASLEWQGERRELNNRVAQLRRSGAPDEEVKAAEVEYDRRDRENATEAHDYLLASKFAGKVGVFEGAGYASKGLYRPMVDCIMFAKGTTEFCAVCKEAMVQIMQWYTE